MTNKIVLVSIFTLAAGLIGGYAITQTEINTKQKEQPPVIEASKSNCVADDCLAVEDVTYPVETLSTEVQNALVDALKDEYLAYTTYQKVIEKLGMVRPFSMIIRAEENHISSLKALFDKYGMKIPENTVKATAPATLQQACQVGVEAEIANAKLYKDTLLPTVSGHEDIASVFTNLMNASEQKHLVAFEKCN